MSRLAILGCALLIGAADPAVRKTGPAPAPPPYAGVYQPHGVDEVGMWREDDESERELATSPLVIRDEALTGYVKGVLCAAVGSDRCAATRVYIMRVPLFNASMSPNGTMRVYSGLLLRVRSEAELAAVLGHEFGHFERRHTLQEFKASRSNSDLMSWAAILASISPAPYGRSNFQSLQLSAYGGLYRFKRDQEREADLLGLDYLNRSALRPQAAAQVWRNVMAETEVSARSRGLKQPRFDRVAFFASHPPSAERAAYLAELAAPDGDARDEGAGRYAAALRRWTPIFLDDQVKLNDFGASDYIITMLAEKGWTGPLWTARGDLFRSRGAPRDLVNAADFYAQAIAIEPDAPAAHRGRGLALLKIGRIEEGRAALHRYLELDPDATDAAMIAMTLSSTGASR